MTQRPPFARVGRAAATAVASAVALVVVAGCGESSPATRPAGATDADLARPAYWFELPANATARAVHFDRLWDAAAETARLYQFPLDRADRRHGVMTTGPVTSQQFFEFWRRDVTRPEALAQSSLGTVRRTVRFEFARSPSDGTWTVSPKVLVERFATVGRRITSGTQYHGAFDPGRAEVAAALDADPGTATPLQYWYPIGRDEALEQEMAVTIREKLR